MKFSEAIIVIKEFFLEVLGFIIPGIVCLSIPIFILNNELTSQIFSLVDKEHYTYTILLISYITGYIIYGASEYKDLIFSWKWIENWKILSWLKTTLHNLKITSFKSYQNNLEEKIQHSDSKKIADKILQNNLKDYDYTSVDSARTLRNLVMSYISEANNAKIYTFTFRADLCRHLSTVFLFYLILAIPLLCFNDLQEYTIFNQNKYIFVFCIALILFMIFLGKTRRRFYSIAHRIPFSIFIATVTKKTSDEK